MPGSEAVKTKSKSLSMRTDSSRGFGAAVAPAVTNGGTTAALMLGAPAPLSLPLSNCPGFFF
jgi:hypothetical protein